MFVLLVFMFGLFLCPSVITVYFAKTVGQSGCNLVVGRVGPRYGELQGSSYFPQEGANFGEKWSSTV